MDKNELKAQALLERVSEITVAYENKCADYRVEITELSQRLQAALAEIERLNSELVSKEDITPDPNH